MKDIILLMKLTLVKPFQNISVTLIQHQLANHYHLPSLNENLNIPNTIPLTIFVSFPLQTLSPELSFS